MRVLVVSEDAKERMRASSALTLHGGADVTEASSAKDGRQLMRDGEFDVLVVDGDLFPQGGFSFLYEVRAAAELAGETSAPAIVMVERQQDSFLSEWSGANEMIMKPVDPFALAKLAREVAGEAGAASTPGPEDEPSDVSGREVKRATS